MTIDTFGRFAGVGLDAHGGRQPVAAVPAKPRASRRLLDPFLGNTVLEMTIEKGLPDTVMTDAPKTLRALKVLRSAWMPAPPPESEPAMVKASTGLLTAALPT